MMKTSRISKAWTNEERLYVIACCATFTIKHLEKGGRYGEIGTPNMEAIRIISVEDPAQLESARRDIEIFVKRSRMKRLPDLLITIPEARLGLIRACSTRARDHAMAGGAYGAKGIPTMETILLLATGSLQDLYDHLNEILECAHGVKVDMRSGLQAFDETVAMFDKAMVEISTSGPN